MTTSVGVMASGLQHWTKQETGKKEVILFLSATFEIKKRCVRLYQFCNDSLFFASGSCGFFPDNVLNSEENLNFLD